MQPNYRYILDKLTVFASCDDATVLDYGCGVGDIVQESRRCGFRTYGVEKFYGGSDIRDTVEQKGLLGDIIFELDSNGRIPFDDQFFDLVVSNQVFEHVEDLQSAFNEVARVIKPGGQLLCLFPSLGIVREVHCGIPMVHWLPKRSKLRYFWLLLFRTLSFGAHKAGKSRRAWAADFAEWLRNFTHYRSRREIKRLLGREFSSYRSLEGDYVSFRLRQKGLQAAANIVRQPFICVLTREACRRYGGLVFVVKKA